MKYLKDFNYWHELGYGTFLCNYYRDDELFELFKPTREELVQHEEDGFDVALENEDEGAWGCYSGGGSVDFNNFRQNIVLFMAAMAGEL